MIFGSPGLKSFNESTLSPSSDKGARLILTNKDAQGNLSN